MKQSPRPSTALGLLVGALLTMTKPLWAMPLGFVAEQPIYSHQAIASVLLAPADDQTDTSYRPANPWDSGIGPMVGFRDIYEEVIR